jgi:hypothetical protein
MARLVPSESMIVDRPTATMVDSTDPRKRAGATIAKTK